MFSGRQREGAEIVSLTGASLISAVGSLFLHLGPFLTVAMIAGGWTSVAGAGWVRSLMQVGEIAIALALPLIGITRVGRRAVGVVAVVFVLGIAMAAAGHQPVFLLGWLVIGACGGVLKYLGTMAAAKASQISFAFSLRLAVVLMLAGVVSAALAAGIGALTYDTMLLLLAIIVAAILLVGMLTMRPGEAASAAASAPATPAAPTRSRFAAVSGLVAIYLFLVGVSGVMVFVLHQAAEHQMTLSSAAWAIAATKLTVGIWLVSSAYYKCLKGKSDRFFLQGVILAAAVCGISLSSDGVTLLCALFFFEVAMNSLSARIQAAVIRGAPEFTSRYVNFAMLAGLTTGPLINGFLLSTGHAHVYVLLGAVAAFAPALWHWLIGERDRLGAFGTYLARALTVPRWRVLGRAA